jgi:hypothetical protein
MAPLTELSPDDFGAIQCRKCFCWSHIACVQPLAYIPSDSDTESLLSWHDPEFDFICVECKSLPDTPQVDSVYVFIYICLVVDI